MVTNTTTAAEHAEEFLRRVRELREWFSSTLRLFELRDAEAIDEACSAFVAWAEEGWDGGADDTLGALTHAWADVPALAIEWREYPPAMTKDFPPSASPPWEPEEVALVAGLVCSMTAEHLLEHPTQGPVHVAAMLYGDAIEASQHWLHARGYDRCRNSNTTPGRYLKQVEAEFKAHERAEDRTADAAKAAKAKHANDPKQAAKAGARALWVEWQAGKHPKLRTVAQFAVEVMNRWPVLTSAKVIEQWSAKWSKEAAAARAAENVNAPPGLHARAPQQRNRDA